MKAFYAGLQIAQVIFHHWKEKYAKRSTAQKAGFASVKIVPSSVNGLLAEAGSMRGNKLSAINQ